MYTVCTGERERKREILREREIVRDRERQYCFRLITVCSETLFYPIVNESAIIFVCKGKEKLYIHILIQFPTNAFNNILNSNKNFQREKM